MTKVLIDRLTPTQLQERYGIKHGAYYDRLTNLNITLAREGKKSYANAEQIAVLDEYHTAIERGEGQAFLREKGLIVDKVAAASTNNGKLAKVPKEAITSVPAATLLGLLPQIQEMFAQTIASLKPEPLPTPEPDPFAHLRKLDEVAAHGWVLPSAMVRDLIGAWPPGGDRFERWGFNFTRIAKKQPWWKIEKN
jgi:hypothetical protein